MVFIESFAPSCRGFPLNNNTAADQRSPFGFYIWVLAAFIAMFLLLLTVSQQTIFRFDEEALEQKPGCPRQSRFLFIYLFFPYSLISRKLRGQRCEGERPPWDEIFLPPAPNNKTRSQHPHCLTQTRPSWSSAPLHQANDTIDDLGAQNSPCSAHLLFIKESALPFKRKWRTWFQFPFVSLPQEEGSS